MKKQKYFLWFVMVAVLVTVVSCKKMDNQKVETMVPDTSSSGIPYRIETLAMGLNVPWDMDISKDGRLFFTERPGFIRVIQDGKLIEAPVLSLTQQVVHRGEGGLLGLVLDPNFEHNHYIYVYHTYSEDGKSKNRVLRIIENNNRARVDKVIIDNLPGAQNHNGGRIKIGPDRKLYITAGEIYQPQLAQDKHSLGGKILRFNLDGSVPADNPFEKSPIYSMGHRNPQGLAWQPETGRLFSSEHGQTAHDEINIIEPGANYGWPVIEGSEKAAGMKEPLIHSGEETWAPSGIAFVKKGPWKGNLLAANLRGQQLLQLEFGSDHTQVIKVNK
jgi:glucose/arabinose dehydrogenase